MVGEGAELLSAQIHHLVCRDRWNARAWSGVPQTGTPETSQGTSGASSYEAVPDAPSPSLKRSCVRPWVNHVAACVRDVPDIARRCRHAARAGDGRDLTVDFQYWPVYSPPIRVPDQASRRISRRASSSMGRPLSAARVRSRLFAWSSRLRNAMLAMSMSPVGTTRRTLRSDYDAIKAQVPIHFRPIPRLGCEYTNGRHRESVGSEVVWTGVPLHIGGGRTVRLPAHRDCPHAARADDRDRVRSVRPSCTPTSRTPTGPSRPRSSRRRLRTT